MILFSAWFHILKFSSNPEGNLLKELRACRGLIWSPAGLLVNFIFSRLLWESLFPARPRDDIWQEMHEMGERETKRWNWGCEAKRKRRNDQGKWQGVREVAKQDKKPILEKGVASLSMRATVPLQVSLRRTLRNGVSESSPPSSFM